MFIYAPHEVQKNSDHYKAVEEYMKKNGAPVIRIVDGYDCYKAIEGSHRLAIANDLKITPSIEIIDESQFLDEIEHDFEIGDILNRVEESDLEYLTVGDIIEYLYSIPTIGYEFSVN